MSFLAGAFYGGESSLQSCANVPESDLKPMYFAQAVGKEEILLPSSISFCNKAEVDEVMWQVDFFWKNWPISWGERDIGIVVGTHDQVNNKCSVG